MDYNTSTAQKAVNGVNGVVFSTTSSQAGPFSHFMVASEAGATVTFTDNKGVTHTSKSLAQGYYPIYCTDLSTAIADTVVAFSAVS